MYKGGGGEVSNTYVGAFYLVTECTIEIIIFGMNCSLIQGIYQITYNDVLLSKWTFIFAVLGILNGWIKSNYNGLCLAFWNTLVRDKIGTQAIQITEISIIRSLCITWYQVIEWHYIRIWESSGSPITMSLCTLSHDSPINFVNEIFHTPHWLTNGDMLKWSSY